MSFCKINLFFILELAFHFLARFSHLTCIYDQQQSVKVSKMLIFYELFSFLSIYHLFN